VSDKELADWLRPCNRPLAVIDCASASAPFLNKLSAPGRVVVTATRTGGEVHYARFGDYLSAAIADPAADLDKDGQTSLLEAFLAASHQTAEFYKQAGRLATEHALLEDNGDALGTPADWFQGTRAVRAAKAGAASTATAPTSGTWCSASSSGRCPPSAGKPGRVGAEDPGAPRPQGDAAGGGLLRASWSRCCWSWPGCTSRQR
jgi:hypothetical protein